MANVDNVYLGVNGQAVDLYSAKKMYVGFNNKAVEIPLGQSKFDYKTWLASASLSATGYANLDAVLADEVAVRKLMTIHASVDYLASWKTTDEDIVKILSNDICAKWITLRDYALDTLDKEYRSLMESLGKYYYGEWALMPQVPKMTSNTAPYGTASAISEYTGEGAWKAFDGSDSNSSLWSVKSGDSNLWLRYAFVNPVKVTRAYVKFKSSVVSAVSYKFQAYNGSSWVDVSDTQTALEGYVDFSTIGDYSQYQLLILSQTASNVTKGQVLTLQFYAWAPKGNVPIMTSNTAPYGTVNSITAQVGSANIWYAFDNDENTNTCTSGADSGVGYMFTNPVCVKRVYVRAMESRLGNVCLEATNDGTNWVSVSPYITTPNDGKPFWFDVDNDTYYMGYRVHTTQGGPNACFYTIQFYGREMKVSVPVMTSNTAPYGEVISDSQYSSSYAAWYAFDSSTSTRWNSSASSFATRYVGYHFINGIKVNKVFIRPYYGGEGLQLKIFKVQASNDNTTWVDLTNEITLENREYSDGYSVDVMPTIPYTYYRVECLNSYAGNKNNVSIEEIQFYSFDYSEYDWDTVNPRHYLYDHGVEPNETLATFGTDGSTLIADEKFDSELYGYRNSGQTSVGWYTTSKIDLTPYNLLRIVGGMYGGTNQSDNDYYVISIGNGLPPTWDERSSYVANLNVKSTSPNDYPNTSSLDLSSVSSSYTVSFQLRSYSVVVRDGSIKEWWLE